MIAKLQQRIITILFAAAAVWLYANWTLRPWLAAGGVAVVLLGYSLVLGIEFALLKIINRRDETPQPTLAELLKAWWGETKVAPRVFLWRQPFRSHCIPDHLDASSVRQGRRGVVFVHGFFCNRGFWTPWLAPLQSSGNAFVAVNLEPVFGSIDRYAELIDDAVARVTAASGLAPVLVCHSMGGLAARAWLRAAGGPSRVHHVFTIGTPHRGTWLGRFSRAHNGSQMRLSSDWLAQLAAHESASESAQFTCWYSNCDNIVFPTSTATLPGADNRLVRGAAHAELAFHPRVMQPTLAIISAM